MTTALLLLRTPLQAWIAQQVLLQEKVHLYDLLYFTQNDAPEDRHYFEKLSGAATYANYCYAPIQRFNILCQLDFLRQSYNRLRDSRTDLVLLSSIDALLPSAIAQRQTGELITFDDGTANFNEGSVYYLETSSWRAYFYRRLFGATDLASTKRRIARHYTLYPHFPNIVEVGRLRVLRGWSDARKSIRLQKAKTYFIGQPFEESFVPNQITSLERKLREFSIDAYVRHPRERFPLNIDVPFLDKRGLIAEDAILADAAGREIHLIGCFSSVMFNLANVAEHKTMFLFATNAKSPQYERLARQAGCDILII
jgi:N-acetyllactosaminide alpha-2,3-sialyltransferase